MNSKSKISTAWIIVFTILGVTLAACVWRYIRVCQNGKEIGSAYGNVVGVAIGSYEGLTNGIQEGLTAGEAQGLSAEDTVATIKGTLEETKNLQVMSANVILDDLIQIDKAYKGLVVLDAKAVFTVDLSKAEVSSDGKTVTVVIPEPEMDFYMDQNSSVINTIDNKASITVDAKDGITAYFNSMSKLSEEAANNIKNYDYLAEEAEKAAKTQVQSLLNALCISGQNIIVSYPQEG